MRPRLSCRKLWPSGSGKRCIPWSMPWSTLLLFLVSLPASAVRAPPPREQPLVQYFMNFGKCTRQQQEYGTWLLYFNMTEQRLAGHDKLVFWLDTRGMSPVNTTSFGDVQPATFPIRQVNFAYFNATLGVQRWSPELDRTPYRETSSWYRIQVDGKRISTIKDLKDSGRNTRTSSVYSLKGTLNGAIKPAKERYKIEILKSCSTAIGCVTIPDPAKVFVNAAGHVAYAFWNVGQSLTVNGVQVKDHAWCPVQTAIVVR